MSARAKPRVYHKLPNRGALGRLGLGGQTSMRLWLAICIPSAVTHSTLSGATRTALATVPPLSRARRVYMRMSQKQTERAVKPVTSITRGNVRRGLTALSWRVDV